MKQYVKAPEGTKYLSQFMTDLPDNCMFHKVTTGCGMTTLVLENQVKYVIAMPYTNLITNKSAYCTTNKIDHLAIYAEGNQVSDISTFTGSKILCTYDQLKNVTQAINASEWKLLVDEAHILLTSAGYRRKAVQGVLDSFKAYKSYVFGSATHHDDKYQLNQLKGIDAVELQWENLQPVEVIKTVVNTNLYDHAAVMVSKYINGSLTGNAHIFVNSVDSIMRIINKSTAKDVRIVCASTEYNEAKIQNFNRRAGTKLNISSVNTPIAKINFYTSTAFEGVDVFDTEGHNIIIADGIKDHTKIDVLTTLPQIIGRVRDSKYKATVELLYQPTKDDYLATAYEDVYMATVERLMKEKADAITIMNTANNATITNAVMTTAKVDSYYYVDDFGSLQVNELAKQSEMANWKNIHQTFYVNKWNPDIAGIVTGSTENNGITYNWTDKAPEPIKGLSKALLGKKPAFKDLCLEYIDTQDKEIAILYPIIKEAFDKLGAVRMETLQFEKQEFTKELTISNVGTSVEAKVIQLFKYKVGEFVSRATTKERLATIYSDVGSPAKAKATDIEKYYEVMETSKRINGEKVKGFTIIAKKF